MRFPIPIRTRCAVALVTCCGLVHIQAAIPLPEWYGDPDTTRQGYQFTTGSFTPTPEILENPHGAPDSLITLGGFATGWQDPDSEFDLSGVDEDGAWDIGVLGEILVNVRFAAEAAAPGTHYRVDFEVFGVSYLGITALPGLDTVGLIAEDLTYTQSFFAPDPLFFAASWQGQRWQGTFDNLTSNMISFAIVAPDDNISVVDTLEIFTRVTLIPEPSAALLVLASMLGFTLRRSRQ